MSEEELVPSIVSYEKLLFVMNGRSMRRESQTEQLYALDLTHDLMTLNKRIQGQKSDEENEIEETR